MKLKTLAAALIIGIAAPAFAADRYTEARIYQIETSDLGMYVYLQVVSGDLPPQGNGGSNEPISKPYLVLASTAQDMDLRKALIASAMVALTTNTIVRFRWDDSNSRITHLLLRS